MNDALEDYLAAVSDDLPTVPDVATRVIDALDSEDASLDDVRKLIERDPALSARVLKVSNSSLYGFATEIQSLGQAISLVGGRAVRNLVMAVAMRETYANFGALEQMLWEHSMAAGPVVLELARRLAPEVDADEAFTIGLLHDVGKTALANSHRDEYAALAERVFAGGTGFVELEREVFGFDHAALGARVVERWSLPARAVSMIANHHDMVGAAELGKSEAKLTALVSLATGCLTKLGSGRPSPVDDLNVAEFPAWKMLKLDDSEVEPVLEICRERIAAASAFAN